MKTRFALATGLFCAFTLTSSLALADSTPVNVLVYQPAFFADARPNTAYDMIDRLPGFAFDDGENARGFAGTAGNVVIDGERPTTKTDDLEDILKRIPANAVARIEVIRGGAEGIDMHGKTVIANVVRKHTASSSLVTFDSINLWPNGQVVPYARLEYTRQSDGWLYEASLARTGNYDDSVGDGRRYVTDAAGHTTPYGMHSNGRGAGWSFNGAVTMPLFGGRFKTNLTLETDPFHSALVYRRSLYHEQITDDSGDRKAELGLHWNGHLGSGMTLETLILQRLGHQSDVNIDNAPGDLEQFSSASDTGETIARATLTYDYAPGLSFEAGAEGAYNFLDGTSRYLANGVDVPLPSANARVEERRGEAFAQGTWKFGGDFTLEAGARFEFSTISETGDTAQSRSFFYPKPRAVLSWTPQKDTQVRLRLERVVGQLDFSDFVASSDLSGTGVSAGNADLKPEQRMQYALSYERHFWNKAAVVLTLLHEEISDVEDYVPIYVPSGAFDAPGNIGNGTNNEADVELTLPLDRIGIANGLLKSTAIWRYSEVTDPVTGQTRRISGQRPNKITIDFSQDLQSLKSTWGINYFHGWDESYYRLISYQHKDVPPPYLEIYWEYKPDPGLALRVEVDNVVPFLFERRQYFYDGARGSAPPAEIERLELQSQPRLYLRIRKTL